MRAMEFHERLRKARIDAGYKSAAEAARRLSVPYGTYSGHENGQRGVRWEDVRKYAKAFKVPSGWLFNGDFEAASPNDDFPMLVFNGIVRDGGLVEIINPLNGVLLEDINGKTVDAFYDVHLSFISGDGVIAFYLGTNDFRPLFKDGDILLVSEFLDENVSEYLYKYAAFYSDDGQIYFRELHPSAKKGLYNLQHFGRSLITDQKVIAVRQFMALVKVEGSSSDKLHPDAYRSVARVQEK